MKRRILCEVKPYYLDGFFILSLAKEWANLCGGVPQFTAVIDQKGRLSLLGPVVSEEAIK